MHVTSLLVAALVALRPVTAAPASQCTNTIVRKEWRTLSQQERLDYINAVKCIQSSPSRVNGYWAGAKSRYDDYQGIHIAQTDYIHFCGKFLPWHRNFIALFEKDLRETCSYKGGLPYWDWTLDATSVDGLANSPIWDETYGFGGNGEYIEDISGFPDSWILQGVTIPGRTGGGCISTGPFASRNVSMGEGNSTAYTPHCLHRDFSGELFALTANSTVVQWAMESESHWWLDRNIEGYALAIDGMRVHAGGHLSVGGQVGEMTNTYSSPGDPVFFLHHSNIDRLWASWQLNDWNTRKTDIGGPDTEWAYPFNYFGDIPYENVTLSTPLSYSPLSSDIEISKTMDFTTYCYTYDEFY
ncbi:Di-copper centre-containing protein [Thozetella sp. PMI_491]|nr:Di-copper centre-containing protein [Thozetella sp. PMI_491]